MTFRSDDGETSRLLHLGRKLDIGTTSRHIGGYGHGTLLSGLSHNVGLLLMELRVEYLMRNLTELEHLGEKFGNFHRRSSDKHWATGVDHILHLLDDCRVLLLLGAVDTVIHIVADNGTVGGDLDHIEFIDIVELAGLGHGGTGHTGKLPVHDALPI